MLFTYRAIVTSVYDGDTITATLDLGFGIQRNKVKLRLYGMNTPELRTKDPQEKKDAVDARDFLRSQILHKDVVVETIKDKTGKYGRYLAIIHYQGVNINDLMVEKGFAKPM
jgi:micrococcal nuclease